MRSPSRASSPPSATPGAVASRENDRLGWYRVEGNSVRILKGPDANPDSESVLLSIDNSKATAIVSLSDRTAARQISLPRTNY
jgi:hypothetical protein